MGKTKLIKEIISKKVTLQPFLNIYHIDTKKRGDFTTADGVLIQSEVSPDAYRTTGNRMVWQPYYDDMEVYSTFFTRILEAGLPSIVDIDETINMKFGSRIPRGLSILLAQGRLPGISVIGGTQEVAQSPRQLLSQATYIISFSLINPYDERTMARMLHLESSSLGLKKHQFWFLDTDSSSPAVKYNGYKDFLPRVR